MGNFDDGGGSGYDNLSNLNGSIENDGPMPTNQNTYNRGGFDARGSNHPGDGRGMTAGGFSQGHDFDQRSNNSKVSKASKSGHKKKKPKGQRELDEDVSQLEDIISQQHGDDSRSAHSARGGNRMPAPAVKLGDKLKSHGSIEAERRPGINGLAGNGSFEESQIPQ